MNFYTLLGVPPDADEAVIRAAYHVLALRYHPDRGPGSSAETFQRITNAYETLIDAGKRRAYDLALRSSSSKGSFRATPPARQPVPLRQEDPSVFGRYYYQEPLFWTSYVHLFGGFPEPPE